MKTLIINTGFFILLLLMMGAGCKKENSQNNPCAEPYKVIESLSSHSGLIGFDEKIGKYFIQIHVEGTIDEIITAYPCELAEEFKKINLKVIVSGDLFEGKDLPAPVLGGQKIFYINIKNIDIL
ncbi:MAG TPA: hypothetical protein PLN06_08675 [Bacteroidales bacterium]|nr:hypothetical protein [Bacteroidales bacterium]HOU96680.1 hypothetical protein [Bacteroidales bacterium]HQG37097.1 hypothetical protein [Bacteroidales bacterium]HQG52442.1 hypothetical protein [Bacteroidales bacterium]HQJ21505.1 hypothetical protein [Bacteroidales bacterium]